MSSFHVVMRLVHFVSGNVSAQPVSFHKTVTEAESAKNTEREMLSRQLKVHAARELLQRIGITAISFEVGEFASSHEDLVQVPRLIIPPS